MTYQEQEDAVSAQNYNITSKNTKRVIVFDPDAYFKVKTTGRLWSHSDDIWMFDVPEEATTEQVTTYVEYMHNLEDWSEDDFDWSKKDE